MKTNDCEICNKNFVKQKGLTMHVSLVHGKAGFLSSRVPIREDCPFCGAWTGTRLKLVQHLRVGTLACRLQAASLPLLCAADFAAALEADRQVHRKSRLLGVGELACAAGRWPTSPGLHPVIIGRGTHVPGSKEKKFIDVYQYVQKY